MNPTRSTKNIGQGILITLYKSVIPVSEIPKRKDFLLWGASKFLYTEIFDSLSHLAISGSQFDSKDLNATPSTENRYLYIYKDNTTNLFPDKKLDWIFGSNPDFPLIVITILKNEDLNFVSIKTSEKASSQTLFFDLFKTTGHGSGVLIFRSKTYDDVLGLLVELNEHNESTYSIAGIQNLLKDTKLRQKLSLPIFSKIRNTKSSPTRSYEAFVSLSYMLRDGTSLSNRVVSTLTRIRLLRDEVVSRFNLPSSELLIIPFYEIGHYDIEITIQGNIIYLLELLLNPLYGLANIESNFYKDCVFETRIAWKTPVQTIVEMEKE